MSDPSSPPQEGDRNRGPVILIVGWIECVVALGFLCGRLHARIKVNQSMGLDDWAMIVSFIFALTFVCIAVAEVHYGTGRHVYYLNAHQRVVAMKLNWISQAFHIMSTCFGKISIVIFILRIMGKGRIQAWFLYILISGLIVSSVLCVAFIFAQCSPTSALWDLAVAGKCWNPKVQQDYGYFTASYSTFSDLVLAIFPVSVLWNLQMNSRTKLSLSVVMGLGVFAATASIFKTVQLQSLSARGDYTYDTLDLIIWMMTEQFVIIIAACIPPMRPLFISFFEKASKGDLSGRFRSRQTRESGYLSRSRKSFQSGDMDNGAHTLHPFPEPSRQIGNDDLRHPIAYFGHALSKGGSRRSEVLGDGESEEKILPSDNSNRIMKTTEWRISYRS